MRFGKKARPKMGKTTASSPSGPSALAKRVGAARGKMKGKDSGLASRAKGYLKKRGR